MDRRWSQDLLTQLPPTILPSKILSLGSYEQRTDHGPPVVVKHGDTFRRSSSGDLPPTALTLRGPVEGATGRAHLVGTTSGSNSTSHAISSIWLIFCRFFFSELLLKPRYGAFQFFAETPMDDPSEYPPHRHRCLVMGLAATSTPQTNKNLPTAEVCASSTRYTFWRLVPPSSSLYRERMAYAIAKEQRLIQIGGLQTGAMAYAIATGRRIPQGSAIPAADHIDCSRISATSFLPPP